jgi:protein TonB
MSPPTSHAPPPESGGARSADPPGLHVWAPHGTVPFLLDDSRQRMRGAIGASFATHVIGFALALFIAANLPEPTSTFEPIPNSYEIVWLPEMGPGGGGGGGGNESIEPPRQVELPGEDLTSVPVAPPPELENPVADEPEPEPEPLMDIPAVSFASADQALPGVLMGLPPAFTPSQGSGTGGGGGSGTGTGVGPGEGDGLGAGTGGGTGGGAYRPGAGITLPRVLREVKPQYTADAMRAKVQGTVWLEAIVQPDGTVGDISVVKSLDPVFGLDQEAIKAASQWRFAPGTRRGEPVAVIITIELTFTLR